MDAGWSRDRIFVFLTAMKDLNGGKINYSAMESVNYFFVFLGQIISNFSIFLSDIFQSILSGVE